MSETGISFDSLVDLIWRTWVAGGWTMIALCFLSLLIYGSAVRMFIYFSRRDYRRVPESQWSQWIRRPDEGTGEVGEIIRYTQDEVKSVEEVQSRFAEVAASKIPFMDRNINYVNILVSTAPLVGLLGTVMGMLLTFKSIGTGGGEMTDMMARGISAALFPPEVGLCIALPGLVMVMMLKRKRHEYEAFLARLESFTVRRYKTDSKDGDDHIEAPRSRPASRHVPETGDANLVPAAG